MDEGESRKFAFHASVHEDLGVPVVEAKGELDLATADRFEDALSEALGKANGRIVVDLTAVAFMDSSGVNALMNGTRGFREGGGEVAIAAADSPVSRVLRVARLDELLDVYPDARSAAEGSNP